jgi:hypothetical protein
MGYKRGKFYFLVKKIFCLFCPTCELLSSLCIHVCIKFSSETTEQIWTKLGRNVPDLLFWCRSEIQHGGGQKPPDNELIVQLFMG